MSNKSGHCTCGLHCAAREECKQIVSFGYKLSQTLTIQSVMQHIVEKMICISEEMKPPMYARIRGIHIKQAVATDQEFQILCSNVSIDTNDIPGRSCNMEVYIWWTDMLEQCNTVAIGRDRYINSHKIMKWTNNVPQRGKDVIMSHSMCSNMDNTIPRKKIYGMAEDDKR